MRRKALTYEIPPPEGPLQQMTDVFSHLVGKHSTAEWKRACEASLRASRRRRRLHHD